jgi:hypothetical protein
LLLLERADKLDLPLDAVEHPCFVSHDSQSAAWILECRSLTVTAWSGHCLRRAYIATVIDVHDPRPARRRSSGFDPVSVPPTDVGSSPDRR